MRRVELRTPNERPVVDIPERTQLRTIPCATLYEWWAASFEDRPAVIDALTRYRALFLNSYGEAVEALISVLETTAPPASGEYADHSEMQPWCEVIARCPYGLPAGILPTIHARYFITYDTMTGEVVQLP